MSEKSRLFGEDQRAVMRRNVMAWARSTHIEAFKVGLIEGPGGNGPDILFFQGGSVMAIYIGEASHTSLPDDHNDWCAKWVQMGSPPMSVFLAATEAGASKLLLDQLEITWLRETGVTH